MNVYWIVLPFLALCLGFTVKKRAPRGFIIALLALIMLDIFAGIVVTLGNLYGL